MVKKRKTNGWGEADGLEKAGKKQRVHVLETEMVKKRKIDGCGEADGLEKAGKKQRVCSGVVRKRTIEGAGNTSDFSRGEKRQRLCSLATLSNLNETQLAHVLQGVSEIYDDPDVAMHRTTVSKRNDSLFRKNILSKCTLPATDGSKWIWKLARLDLLMQFFVNKSQWFKDILKDVVQRCGHHLNLVCYTDEITPGDAFAADLPRKAFCVYVSIFEFGPKALCRMEAWMPVGLLRSNQLKNIDGGLPCAFRELFRSWSCGEPLSVSTTGIIIELDEPTLFVFESLKQLQDLDAHRAHLSVKGVGSYKPCWKCRNCMKKGHKSVTESSWQIDITETDTDKFDLATDEEIWQVVDMIAETRAGAERTKLELAHGFNHNKYGIWQDRDLRGFCKPITGTRFDPMHVMYVHGVMSQGLWEYFNDCKRKMKIKYSHINEFVQADWKCPFQHKRHFAKVRKCFTKKREKQGTRKLGVKMMASEQMTVYPLIRRFAELNDCEELHDASISFYSICEVADVLQQAKFQHFKCKKTMAKLIKDLVGKYLKVRKAIYGTKGIRPKHHKLMHLWKQLLDDGFLMDCFILEHMHCLIKPLCVDLRNTKDFEGTAIRRAVQARVHQLEKKEMERRLVGEQKLCPQLSAVLEQPTSIARLLVLPGGQQLHTEDIVFLGEDLSCCFLIKACYMSAVPGLVLQELRRVEVVTSSCSRWQRTSKSRLLHLSDAVFVQHAKFWSIKDDGVIEVLHSVDWSC